MNINVSEKSNFIWKIADLLRGDYKQSEYGDVILPFTVLCRLDSVLAPTKDEVMAIQRKGKYKTEYAKLAGFKQATGGLKFYNISDFTFAMLKNDAGNIADNLTDYIKGFSENARTILESFDIYSQIARLDKADLLYLVVTKFIDDIDLHPDHVSNNEMGYIFEELIRKFSEMSNETAGEHFTPREVIRLMVSMLFTPDMQIICEPGFMAKLYDPAAGTGGMLSAGIEYAAEQNDGAIIEVYGQELNEKTYAICKSDTMIKGKGYENIHLGNSFTDDKLKNEAFHYMLCNPPFGVEWKKYEKFIRDEAEDLGYAGRFGAGLPRVSDGSLLFLQHMISKMMEYDPEANGISGCRLGIVFNGSPLFTGDAGSGESEIRKWIIENGWLETIIALPDQLFYNTPILTYVWIVTNRKKEIRKGKIQLIDGTSFFKRMRKPLGKKRKTFIESHIAELTQIYGNFVEGEFCKILDEDDFAYWKVTIERPLRANFQASGDRIENIRKQTTFANLANSRKRKPDEIAKEVAEGKKKQEAILAAISQIDDSGLYKNRPEFAKIITKALKEAGIEIKASLLKAILIGLSKKDETADICTDTKGNPEPDVDLRETLIVPFKADIDNYILQEVLPYTPDAWANKKTIKKGYEIPFTRLFYKYSEEIVLHSASIKVKETRKDILENIQRLLYDSHILVQGVGINSLVSSPIDWIPNMPTHWQYAKAKHVFKIRESKGNEAEVLLAATQKYGMFPQDELEGVVQVKEETDIQTFRTVHINDFVISLRSFQGGFEMSDYEGVCSPAYQVFYNKIDIFHPYYKLLFKSAAFISKINSLTIGIRDGKNILFKDFGEVLIPIPPKDEQQAIVSRLEGLEKDTEEALFTVLDDKVSLILGGAKTKFDLLGKEEFVDDN